MNKRTVDQIITAMMAVHRFFALLKRLYAWHFALLENKNFPICLVLLSVLVGVFPALAIATDKITPTDKANASHLSLDPQVVNARQLIEGGNFNQALVILRPLIAKHPDQTDVHFLIGLAAISASSQADTKTQKAALLDEAIAALRAILIDRPGLVRVRLELARAFYLKGDDGLSQVHFKRVLAGKPLPAMAANIRRFLQTMRTRRRWSGYFGFSLAPDSNISGTSDTKYIYINGNPFRRDEDSLAKSGIGVVLWGGGQYQYPLHQNWRLATGIDVYHKEYPQRRFDQSLVSLYVGPRFILNPRTELKLLAVVRHRWQGGHLYTRDVGTRFEAKHRLSSRLILDGQAAWYNQEYKHRKNNKLNGAAQDFSLNASLYLTPTLQGSWAIGYSRERPKWVQWRNDDIWTRMEITLTLPMGFTVGGSGEWHWGSYQGNWGAYTPAGVSREDRRRILRLSVFNRAFTLLGFSPQLILVNEDNKSNAQAYGYQRNRAELRFVRQF